MDNPNVPGGEFARHDLGDFAQEFLRRNPRYRAQYLQALQTAAGDRGAVTCREVAERWGLTFPRGS